MAKTKAELMAENRKLQKSLDDCCSMLTEAERHSRDRIAEINAVRICEKSEANRLCAEWQSRVRDAEAETARSLKNEIALLKKMNALAEENISLHEQLIELQGSSKSSRSEVTNVLQ